MPAAGEKRESFGYSIFSERFPSAQEHIFRIREIVNMEVMQQFDIVRQYVQNDGPSQKIPNNVSGSDKVNDVEKQSPELVV